MASRPARGVRIETFAWHRQRHGAGVAPRPGRADRNSCGIARREERLVVAPRPGRADRNARSLNAGVDAQLSRPARGVRIETLKKSLIPPLYKVAPRPGRADRNTSQQTGAAHHDVAPRPGRADRNSLNSNGVECGNQSRPARGVRIETTVWLAALLMADVAPRPGRADRNGAALINSRFCGGSRPARGVRIETVRTGCGCASWVVAPRPGRADRNGDGNNWQGLVPGRAPPGACG